MTDLVSLLFIAMFPIDFKITNFSLHLFRLDTIVNVRVVCRKLNLLLHS